MSQSEQSEQYNRLIEKSTNRKILFTLKSWPVIAIATIGICFLTKTVAGWFGVDLPDQSNIGIVRELGRHVFESWRNFGNFALVVAQVVLILPAIEELVFRWLLFKLPMGMAGRTSRTTGTAGTSRTAGTGRTVVAIAAVVSAAVFTAAHYVYQPWPDAAFIALFFFGLAQCWLYRRTNFLWCPMLNHALFNSMNLVLLFVLPE